METSKKIIKQDASTQTKPVTIIENEETINTPETNTEKLPLKRVKEWQSPNPLKSPKREEKVLSGIENAQNEIIIMEKVKKIKPDVSLYDKCQAYLNSVDPEGYNYYSLLMTIVMDIENGVNLNEGIKCTFAAHDDSFKAKKERIDILRQATAAIYMVYNEKEINLGIGNNIKDAIYADLSAIVGVKMSGKIMSVLEHSEE